MTLLLMVLIVACDPCFMLDVYSCFPLAIEHIIGLFIAIVRIARLVSFTLVSPIYIALHTTCCSDTASTPLVCSGYPSIQMTSDLIVLCILIPLPYFTLDASSRTYLQCFPFFSLHYIRDVRSRGHGTKHPDTSALESKCLVGMMQTCAHGRRLVTTIAYRRRSTALYQ